MKNGCFLGLPAFVLSSVGYHSNTLLEAGAAGELKTKPTQHSVRELMQLGIQPDVLICRSEQPISADIKRKIALFCNVDFGCVVESPDVRSIYEIPIRFFEQGLDREVCQRLRLETKEPDLRGWKAMTERILHPANRTRIAVVGKYTALHDAYKSVGEALIHGGIPHDARVEVEWIPSDRFTDAAAAGKLLEGFDGLLIPGGFGERGVEGMLNAVQWARENDFPFLGICLGLQIAIIEFARNVCDLPDPNSTEFSPECETPVIALMQSQRDVSDLGGTMRLGAYTARLRPGSRVAQAYGTTEISERHRHRWEVSNAYRDVLAEYGLRLSGQSPDGGLVETIELPDHTWFIGCQFHPELKSRPTRPHPLFAGLVGAALKRREAVTAPPVPKQMARAAHVMTWSFGTAPFLIAGPCVIEPGDVLPRVADALARIALEAWGSSLFQGELRQGESCPTRRPAGTGSRRRTSGPRTGPSRERVADTHRHSRGQPRRARSRGRGRPSDSRLSLPSDRPARRRRTHWKAGQREEGPVGPPRGDGRRH